MTTITTAGPNQTTGAHHPPAILIAALVALVAVAIAFATVEIAGGPSTQTGAEVERARADRSNAASSARYEGLATSSARAVPAEPAAVPASPTGSGDALERRALTAGTPVVAGAAGALRYGSADGAERRLQDRSGAVTVGSGSVDTRRYGSADAAERWRRG